jgi:hemolysin D
LDSTISLADVSKTKNDYQQALLDSTRYQNLLAQLNNQALMPWPESSGISHAMIVNSQNQFQNQWLELQDKLKTNQAQQFSQDEAVRTSQTLVSKYQQTLPLLLEKESDYLELYNKKFMSQHGYLDVAKQRIDLQQDLANERGKIRETQAQKQELQRQYALIISDFKLDIGEKLLQATQQANSLQADFTKAEQNQDYTELRAPESGYVQQLAVHTVGGVVTPAEALLVVVPQNGGIMAEVQLENKDIGFVKAGQSAEIKVAAFPFTRYGTLHGVVSSVSADAVQDQKNQLLYNVYIKLNSNVFIVNGAVVPLTSGMMLTAEIKTGKRKIIDYFLSPLIQNTTEAFHER